MSITSLLQARYGADHIPDVPDADGVNATLETLLGHRSVRRYLPRPLPPGTLELLTAAAQSAATSSNLQAWSAVAVQEPERKAEAARLCGDQEFIRQAPLFLVFCADLDRLTRASERQGKRGDGLEYLEMFLIACLDAGFAAQNVAVAAESLGLGICYVGAARNHPRDLADLLRLPRRVVALFGMTVGWPDPAHPASVKPRLPQAEVMHREAWQTDPAGARIAAYDETLAAFDQSEKREAVPWSRRSARRVEDAQALTGRDVLAQILRERGFEMR